MKKGKKCIIVGSGDFSEEFFTYKETDFVIAADGGYHYLSRNGITPQVIIGDFDSIDTWKVRLPEPEVECEIIKLPQEKDDTDMLAAIKWAIKNKFNEIHIYGGLGGRLDHTLANIQCLVYIKKHGANGYLFDKDTMLMVLKNELYSFPMFQKGRMSLFSLDKKVTGVTLKGFRYPLVNATITNDFPIGISNEFLGKAAEIEVKSGNLLVICSK